MAISGYCGLGGSGKSYGVVENVILPALKSKRKVYTNIPMNDDLCNEDFGSSVVNFDIKDIKTNNKWFDEVFQAGSLLVLDEVWELWPSGLNVNKAELSHKEFLAKHRHMVGENGLSTEIILVTQDFSMVAAFVRSLMETTYRSVKLDKVGADKSFRIDIYQGAVTGDNPPVKKKVDAKYGKYSPKVYKYYKSHTMSKTGMAGDETKVDSRFKKITPLKMVFYFVIFCFLIFMLVKLVSSSLGSSQPEVKKQQPQITPVSTNKVKSSIQKSSNHLLSNIENVFISSIGVCPNCTYTYRVFSSDSYASLSSSQLLKLGYTMVAIDECLVVISRGRWSYNAMCEKPEYKDYDENDDVTTSLASNFN